MKRYMSNVRNCLHVPCVAFGERRNAVTKKERKQCLILFFIQGFCVFTSIFITIFN